VAAGCSTRSPGSTQTRLVRAPRAGKPGMAFSFGALDDQPKLAHDSRERRLVSRCAIPTAREAAAKRTSQHRKLGGPTDWLRRFKILQQAATAPRNVARTCRYFGISRKTYYKWKRRYDEHREAGLCDRPRVPHRSPRSTPREVVSRASDRSKGKPIAKRTAATPQSWIATCLRHLVGWQTFGLNTFTAGIDASGSVGTGFS